VTTENSTWPSKNGVSNSVGKRGSRLRKKRPALPVRQEVEEDQRNPRRGNAPKLLHKRRQAHARRPS
jgi:hypothetical protein